MFSDLYSKLKNGNTPLYLAPQAGVSESPFRRLCRSFGADVVVSEFVSAEGLRRGARRWLDYSPGGPAVGMGVSGVPCQAPETLRARMTKRTQFGRTQ